jgi:hypothetical protein
VYTNDQHNRFWRVCKRADVGAPVTPRYEFAFWMASSWFIVQLIPGRQSPRLNRFGIPQSSTPRRQSCAVSQNASGRIAGQDGFEGGTTSVVVQSDSGDDRFVAMAFEPFNIFSHRIDVRGVIAVLRKLADKLTIEGPEDDWQKIIVLGPKKFLRKPARLLISHDSAYYDGPGWSNQVSGMANYFSGFPDVPRKADILRAIHSFRFILAFPEFDLDIDSGDERVAWVHAICRHLDRKSVV